MINLNCMLKCFSYAYFDIKCEMKKIYPFCLNGNCNKISQISSFLPQMNKIKLAMKTYSVRVSFFVFFFQKERPVSLLIKIDYHGPFVCFPYSSANSWNPWSEFLTKVYIYIVYIAASCNSAHQYKNPTYYVPHLP